MIYECPACEVYWTRFRRLARHRRRRLVRSMCSDCMINTGVAPPTQPEPLPAIRLTPKRG